MTPLIMEKSLKHLNDENSEQTGTSENTSEEPEASDQLETETSFIDLLRESLAPDSLVSTIKKVWKHREFLRKFDFGAETDETTTLKNLLLSTTSAAHYLKNADGRSLIAQLFVLPTVDFVEKLHEELKSQVFENRQKQKCMHVGDIYWKAWKAAAGERKQKIEEVCLQHYLRASVCTEVPLASACLEVLRPIAERQQIREVATMLFKLSEPLIWRGISSVNRQIRYNSLGLFVFLFPLNNYDNDARQQEEFLHEQMKRLTGLLSDSVVDIRLKAIGATFEFVSLFWETLWPDELKDIFLLVCNDLAWDSTSTEIRVAVYNGFRKLMENPLTHAHIEKTLPKLANGIHDRKEAVRSTVVNLLLEACKYDTLKFWELVPLKVLVLRLSVEKSQSILERLVKLLYDTYVGTFPPKVQLSRAFTLVKENLTAARKFYYVAGKMMGVEAAAELIVRFLRYAYGTVRLAKSASQSQDADRSDNSERDSESDTQQETVDDNEDENEAHHGEGDKEQNNYIFILGSADCAAVLWHSIAADLQGSDNMPLKKRLFKNSGHMILECVNFFEDQQIKDSFMCLAGFLRRNSFNFFSSSLMKKMKHIPDGGFDPIAHGSLVETLFYWQLKDVCDTILQWWRNFDMTFIPIVSPTPKKAKRVRISEPPELSKPRLGVQILAFALKRYGVREYLLSTHLEMLQELDEELEKLWEHCLSVVGESCFDAESAVEIVRLRASIIVLLTSKNANVDEATNFLATFLDLLRPIKQRVVTDAAEMEFPDELSRMLAVMKASFSIWCDFVMVDLCGEIGLNLAVNLITDLVYEGCDFWHFVGAARLLYNVSGYMLAYENAQQPILLSKVTEAFRHWFHVVPSLLPDEHVKQDLKLVSDPMREALIKLSKLDSETTFISCAMQMLLEVSTDAFANQLEEAPSLDTDLKTPVVCSLLLNRILGKTPLLHSICLRTLSESYSNGNFSNGLSLAASLNVALTIIKKNCAKDLGETCLANARKCARELCDQLSVDDPTKQQYVECVRLVEHFACAQKQ